MTLSTSLVNIGQVPNDGTGDNIRNAFNKTNINVSNISTFLAVSPVFPSAEVSGIFTVDTLVANVAQFSGDIIMNGNLLAISQGNVTIAGDLDVGGTITGVLSSTDLTVNGPTALTGNVVITGNAGITDTLSVGNVDVIDNVTINGSLTVHGNVVTVTTSEFKIIDPIIEIGGGALIDGTPAALTSDDGKNRGIEFFYYDTNAAAEKIGFFGFDTTDDKFVFTDNGGATGQLGTAVFANVEANVISTGSSSFEALTANTAVVYNGITGNLTTAVQPNITGLGTLTTLDVGGNIEVIGGNINLTGGGTVYIDGFQVSLSAQAFTGGTVPQNAIFSSSTPSTDSVSGAVVITGGLGVGGNLNVGGELAAGSFAAALLGGTLTTAVQPNITEVGTLGNLAVTDNISSTSLSVNNITAANFVNTSSLTASTGITGLLLSGSQTNINTLGTLTTLDVSGPVTANTIAANSVSVTNTITGNISGSANTVTNPAQPAITSVGVLTSLDVTDTANIGNIVVGTGSIQAIGNIQSTTNVIGSYLYGQCKTAAQPNITTVGSLSSLAINGGCTVGANLLVAGSINAAGSGTQSIGSTSNRFGTVYAASINTSGTITAGTFVGSFAGTAASVTGQANSATITATSNVSPNTIALRDASSNFAANVITATSTMARYADLAEMYQSDGQYDSGTVVVFGGNREVTTTGHQADVSVAGVVSTAPAYLMNIDAPNAVAVALRGKVPVKLIGPVRKGDLLVTSYLPGYATSVGKDGKFGVAIFAKSLTEDLAEGQKIINAVII